jgi:hypothetical protein
LLSGAVNAVHRFAREEIGAVVRALHREVPSSQAWLSEMPARRAR